eukprot:6956231-Karenia_brevis.AAC.1
MIVDFFSGNHAALDREGLQLHLLLNATPKATATSDFDASYQRLDAFNNGILQELAGVPQMIVAGGA